MPWSIFYLKLGSLPGGIWNGSNDSRRMKFYSRLLRRRTLSIKWATKGFTTWLVEVFVPLSPALNESAMQCVYSVLVPRFLPDKDSRKTSDLPKEKYGEAHSGIFSPFRCYEAAASAIRYSCHNETFMIFRNYLYGKENNANGATKHNKGRLSQDLAVKVVWQRARTMVMHSAWCADESFDTLLFNLQKVLLLSETLSPEYVSE